MSIVYQLSNGKVVYLSVEDLLNMSKEDEQYLLSLNQGDAPNSPFHGSVITKPGRRTKPSNPYEKDGLDYEEDRDEIEPSKSIDLNNIPDESIID